MTGKAILHSIRHVFQCVRKENWFIADAVAFSHGLERDLHSAEVNLAQALISLFFNALSVSTISRRA